MANVLTGTATVAVTDGVATITKVTGDEFSLLTEGSDIQINGGRGWVSSNTGTVITTYGEWEGSASGTAVAWSGRLVPSNQQIATDSGQILQRLNALNDLRDGRVLSASAKDSLETIDDLIDLCVLGNGTTIPPGSPADGDSYIVGTGATGAWSGYDGNVASYHSGEWIFHPPFNGLRALIASSGATVVYLDGWGPPTSSSTSRTISATSLSDDLIVKDTDSIIFLDGSDGPFTSTYPKDLTNEVDFYLVVAADGGVEVQDDVTPTPNSFTLNNAGTAGARVVGDGTRMHAIVSA